MTPTSLKEISARVVKTCAIPFGPESLPRTVIDYLLSANCCVNPACQGENAKDRDVEVLGGKTDSAREGNCKFNSSAR